MCFSFTYVSQAINTATRPESSHPITMAPTALNLALTEAKTAFLPIVGQSTDYDLVQINNTLAPILLKITYDRINGEQNLWGLIADMDRYLHHYGLAFARPATRPAVYDPSITHQ